MKLIYSLLREGSNRKRFEKFAGSEFQQRALYADPEGARAGKARVILRSETAGMLKRSME
jgi:hypothetical protein